MTKLNEAIELRHLRYFIAAVEYGSFRKAAIAIGVRESSVSRRIKQLEQLLGISLFLRHIGGVTLTVAGRRFLPEARKAIWNVGESVRSVASFSGEKGSITVGVISPPTAEFMAILLGDFGRRCSNVMLTFVEGQPDEHIKAVRQQNLDIAFLAGNGPWPKCHTSALWNERVMVALPERHRLASSKKINLQDLTGESFITTRSCGNLSTYSIINCDPTGEVNSIKRGRHSNATASLLSLVTMGRGIVVVYESAATIKFPGVIYLPIENERTTFNAVWASHNANPALSQMLRLVNSLSQKRIRIASQ